MISFFLQKFLSKILLETFYDNLPKNAIKLSYAKLFHESLEGCLVESPKEFLKETFKERNKFRTFMFLESLDTISERISEVISEIIHGAISWKKGAQNPMIPSEFLQ